MWRENLFIGDRRRRRGRAINAEDGGYVAVITRDDVGGIAHPARSLAHALLLKSINSKTVERHQPSTINHQPSTVLLRYKLPRPAVSFRFVSFDAKYQVYNNIYRITQHIQSR